MIKKSQTHKDNAMHIQNSCVFKTVAHYRQKFENGWGGFKKKDDDDITLKMECAFITITFYICFMDRLKKTHTNTI